MGGVHKTVRGQFNDDGSPALKPVAVEAQVSVVDNDPDPANEPALNDLTVAELLVRADIAGIEFYGKAPRKAEIIEALEAEDENGGDGFAAGAKGF